MHLLFEKFELNKRQHKNEGEQQERLRAADTEAEVDESILINVINDDVRCIHRAPSGQDVHLSERLECADDRDDGREKDRR